MKLEDIRPERASFKLSNTKKEYFIRPFNLDDEVWMQKNYGEGIKAVFDQGRWKDIARITYRQLEDRSDFIKQTVRVVNEEGDEATYELGGVELLYTIITGLNDKLAIVQALLQAVGLSRPMQDELVSAEMERIKKKAATETSPSSQDGTKSSTPSQASTDGQPSTSSP